ncbi:MAG: hypothetical protein AB7S81_04700 [Bdellovibrionales bacterium]
MDIYNDVLFDMEWSVDQSGYHVEHDKISEDVKGRERLYAEASKTDWLVPRGGKMRKYNPFLQTPEVARVFSKLPLDPKTREVMPEAAVEFANKYGLLGVGIFNKKGGEDLKEWSSIIDRFSDIFSLLDEGYAEIACYSFNEFSNWGLVMRPSISPAKKKGDRVFEINPKYLCGAMWIMLADELSRGTQLKSCGNPECSTWIKKRSNKKFCSDRCKQRMFRVRQKENATL